MMEAAADDDETPELLEAALSLLEHYEPLEDEVGMLALVDLDVDDVQAAEEGTMPARQVASSNASAAPEEETKRSRSRRKADGFHPNRSREKRKEEVVYLRSKVHDMEAQLAELQQHKATDDGTKRLAKQRKPSAVVLVAKDSSSTTIGASMWEQIAARQSDERRKAELENVRLKLILEGQIKVAKGLEKLLSKRNSPELSIEPEFQFKRLRRQVAPANDEASIFEVLSRSAASAIGDVDAVFAANGLSKTERDFQDSRVCKNAGKGMFMELFANKMMPFPLHAAADVAWEHYTRPNKSSVPSRSYSQKLLNKSNDIIFEQFDVQMHGKRSSAGFHVHKVSRRFVQEDRDRVVIVWRSVVDQIQFSSEPLLSGLRFQEHSYVVIKKPTSMPSGSYSLVQTCFIMIPEVDESESLTNSVGYPGQTNENPSAAWSPELIGSFIPVLRPIPSMSDLMQEGQEHAEPEELEAALSLLEHYEPLDEGDFGGEEYLASEVSIAADLFVFGAPEDENEESYLLAPETNVETSDDLAMLSTATDGELTVVQAQSKMRAKRVRKKTSNFNPNRARERRKEELLYLQTKVREMENQLAQLKRHGGSNSSRAGLPYALCSEDSRSTTGLMLEGDSPHHSAASVWQEMALRQSTQRRKAELENVRLKLILEGQLKVARGLENLLYKRSATNPIQLYEPTSNGTRFRRMNRTYNESDDAEIFEELLIGVDRAQTEVDAIFDANGLSRTERTFQDARVRKNGPTGMYLELAASKMMPFEMFATGNAAWEYFSRTIKHSPSRWYSPKKTETVDDTIMEIFDLEVHGKRRTADFRVRKVIRRYVQEHRVLVVWRSFVQPLEFCSQPTDGIHVHEQGYIVAKRPTTMSHDFSVLQSCFIMMPEMDPSARDQEAKAGKLTDFLLDAIARNIDPSHQMIENCLMDGSFHLEDSVEGPFED